MEPSHSESTRGGPERNQRQERGARSESRANKNGQSGTASPQHTAGGHGQTAAGQQRHGGPAGQSRGSGRPGSAGMSAPVSGSSGDGGRTAVRVVAAVFGLLGVLSLYIAFEALSVSSTAPVSGSGIRMLGLVAFVVGVAYVYAAYGVWTFRRRGWLVGMWLVGAGAFLSLVGLLSGGAAAGLVGLLCNCALGWALHINRTPFRDGHHRSPDSGDRRSDSGQRTAGGAADGYANRRRGQR